MKIYTSYYAMSGRLDNNLTQVAISRIIPQFFNEYKLEDLAPPYWLVQRTKETGDIDFYVEWYTTNILDKLDPHQVARTLGHNSVMLCYEGSDDFCHRHLVSEWLREHGYDVSEIEVKRRD